MMKPLLFFCALFLSSALVSAQSIPLDQPQAPDFKAFATFGKTLEAGMLPSGTFNHDGIDWTVSPQSIVTVNSASRQDGRTLIKPAQPITATHLHFLHTYNPGQGVDDYRLALAQAHRNLELPGRKPTLFTYEIHYADGQVLDMPVRWGESIESWYRVYDVAPMLWAQKPLIKTVNEKTRESVVAYPLRWPNPRPEVAITEIKVRPNNDRWNDYGTGLILGVAASNEALTGRTFFVDPTPVGDDKQPGTLEQPFGTLNHAFTQLKNGDTLYVRGGLYALNRAAVLENHGPANGKWLTISAFPGEDPVIDGFGVLFDPRLAPYGDTPYGPPYQHDFGIIDVADSPGYVRIQGLTVQNSRRSGISAYGVRWTHKNSFQTAPEDQIPPPTHLEVNFNQTSRTNEIGINIKWWDDVAVIGNVVARPHSADMALSVPGGTSNMGKVLDHPHNTPTNNRHHGQEGIDLSQNDRFVVAFNQVFGGGKEAIDTISVQNGSIHNNYVHNSLNGIYIDSWSEPITGLKVFRNFGHQLFAGIPCSTEGGNNLMDFDIYENIMVDSHMSGISVNEATYKATPAIIKNHRVFNNTVHRTGEHADSINWMGNGIDVHGFTKNKNFTDVSVFNNIVTDGKHLPYSTNFDNLAERNIRFTHNLAFPNAIIANPRMTEKIAADGFFFVEGENRLAADPLYVNPTLGDFRLQENSPARGAGLKGEDLGAIPYGAAWIPGFDFSGQPTAFYYGEVKWNPVFIPNEKFNAHRNRIERPRFFQQSRYGEDLEHMPAGTLALGGVIWQIEADRNTPVPNVILLAGIQAEIDQEKVTDIPVNRQADKLAFLHTAYVPGNPERQRAAAENRLTLAEYVVHYSDGTSVTIPIIIGDNILNWKSTSNPANARIAYHIPGINQQSRIDTSLFSFEWTNPHPEKTISHLDVQRVGDPQAGNIALFAISTGDTLK